MEIELDVDAELACCLVHYTYIYRIITSSDLDCAYSAAMEITCACSLWDVPRGQKRDIHYMWGWQCNVTTEPLYAYVTIMNSRYALLRLAITEAQ